jgi:hypothetical protein
MEDHPPIDLVWGGIELVVREESDAWVPDVIQGRGLIHASKCIVQGTLFGRKRVFENLPYSEDRSIWYQDLDLVQRARGSSEK